MPKPYSRMTDNFFVKLIEGALGLPVRLTHSPRHHVDIALTSTHPAVWSRGLNHVRGLGIRKGGPVTRRLLDKWDLGKEKPSPLASTNIWTSGENLRPPAADWDLSLSHDIDDFGGQNIYLPFWMEAIGVYAQPTSNFLGERPSLNQMLSARQVDPSTRSNFACAFLGKETGLRMQAIRALSELGRVDVFGPAVGRPVENKESVASHYKFVLCFENDLYPGYVTEKPFDAWATGAVPLYWGNDAAGYLNPRSLINFANFADFHAAVEFVAQVLRDPSHMASIASEPVLQRAPDYRALETLMRERLAPLLDIS